MQILSGKLTAKQEFYQRNPVRQGLDKNLSPHTFCWHSDAKASLCQQKKNIKNTRLRKGKGKHRRLWRLAVATHPPIAEPTIILNIIRDASVPLRGTNLGGGIARTHSCAASQLAVGFHYIGPAPRNPQLKLNLLVVRGCVATARRHSLLRLPFFCRAI